jgi:hypothetical protein
MPPLGTDRQAEPDLAECGSRHLEPDDVLRHRRDPDQVSYEQGGPLFAAIWLAEPRHIGTFAIGQHGKAAHEDASDRWRAARLHNGCPVPPRGRDPFPCQFPWSGRKARLPATSSPRPCRTRYRRPRPGSSFPARAAAQDWHSALGFACGSCGTASRAFEREVDRARLCDAAARRRASAAHQQSVRPAAREAGCETVMHLLAGVRVRSSYRPELLQCRSLMHGDMVRLIAFDLILRLVFAGMMPVPFVIHVF